MDALFGQMKKLYDNEQYESVLAVANMMDYAHLENRTLIHPEQYYLMFVYSGDSLYNLKFYRQAEQVYRNSLRARKAIVKRNPPSGYEKLIDQYSEMDTIYKIAKCYDLTSQPQQAVRMLELVPVDHRTPKVNTLLGRLSLQTGQYNQGKDALIQAIRECPMNFEAIKYLLAFGTSEHVFADVLFENRFPPIIQEWIKTYVEVVQDIKKSQFTAAIHKLEALKDHQFGRNELVNVTLGQCYFYNGDFDLALSYIKKAQANNFYIMDGLSTLSAIYVAINRVDELEKLAQLYMKASEHTTEHWIVFANYYYMIKNTKRAAFYARRACLMDTHNVEANLAKVRVHLLQKKYIEAITLLRALMEFASYRFDVYDYMVSIYIDLARWREAQHTGADVCRTMGKTPRTLMLAARTLMSDPEARHRAKPYLERVLKLDKYHESAILLLVTLLEDEENTSERAIDLLVTLVQVRPSSDTYRRLGDLYLTTNEPKKACENYVLAVNMDPTNRAALDQLEQLEQLGVRSGKILVSTDMTATVVDIIARPIVENPPPVERDLEMERARELREQRERDMAQRERLREQEHQRRLELHEQNTDTEMRSSSTNESNAENMGSDSDGVWSEGDIHIPMRDE